VPGSYVAKGVKIAAKATHAVRGAKVAKAVTKGGKIAKTIKKAATNLHHAWPKYLGGLKNQKLLALPRDLHIKYHKGLDKVLPRRKGAKYYRSLSGAEQAEAFEKLREYTEAFDRKHGTQVWDRLKEEATR